MEKHFSVERYLLMSVDPIHIGAGGYRLGRVDNSVVREPGTRLPKIPGTSLHGAIRHYAAYRYRSPGKPLCSGQDGHCGEATCPVCYTFGYARSASSQGDQNEGYAGVVNISDARILFFPVYSMLGPVWVSAVSLVKAAGFDIRLDNGPVEEDELGVYTTFESRGLLNLGWLMLKNKGSFKLSHPQWSGAASELDEITKNLVLVSDRLFSRIVNSNLEVRTSVSINPETGAAEDKALFTYEAIPRATFFWMDVVCDNYRNNEPWLAENKKDALGNKSPLDVVRAGLDWLEHLGVGGMGTRGFGRLRCLAKEGEVS